MLIKYNDLNNLDLDYLIDTLKYLATLTSKSYFNNLLLDFVGLPHVLVPIVHLVHFIGLMGKRLKFICWW